MRNPVDSAPLLYTASVEATKIMTEAIEGEEFSSDDHTAAVAEATTNLRRHRNDNDNQLLEMLLPLWIQ